MKSSWMREKPENKIHIGSTQTLKGDGQTQMLDLEHSIVIAIIYMWLTFIVNFYCMESHSGGWWDAPVGVLVAGFTQMVNWGESTHRGCGWLHPVSWRTPEFSCFPASHIWHDVSCLTLPCSLHHDGLTLYLKLWDKVNLKLFMSGVSP